MSPARRVPKPKLLFDEGFPPRRSFSSLNRYFTIRHVAHDLKLSGASDTTIYDYACEHDLILVTFNGRHFYSRVKPSTVTVVAVSMQLTTGQMDRKLTSKLKTLKPSDSKGKYIKITK